MSSHDDAEGVYQEHRDHQRERILDAAGALFVRDGIHSVSMSAIAKAARLSRKTLYEYFPDKQAIAWAIFERIIEALTTTFPRQPDASGYQQLAQLTAWAMKELEAHPERQRLIVEFNALYAREIDAGDRMRAITSPHGSSGVASVGGMVRKGIADGSLRPDLDPELVAAALLNLFGGMNGRFALLGDRIREEGDYPVMAIYREICHLFLRGLRSEGS